MLRCALAAAALAALLATAAVAQTTADVYCGSFTPIKFRATAGGQSPQTRADKATEIINKCLGGKAPAVVQKADGKNIKLMVKKDVLATVTPADVKAEKAKSVKALATSWAQKLSKALKESCAQK